MLAIGVLVIGAMRQRRGADALRHGGFEPLSSPLVSWLTAAGVLLALGTIATIAVSV